MKKEELEEVVQRLYPLSSGGSAWMPTLHDCAQAHRQDAFIEGVKWQQKNSYSQEEVIELLQKYRFDLSSGATPNLGDTTEQWLEQYKKR